MTSSLSLHGILDANKLIGSNYVNWMRNLRIILIQEKVSYILDISAPDSINEGATEEEKATYKMWQDDSVTVKCIMLASMSNELQRQNEGTDVSPILLNLKELYEE